VSTSTVAAVVLGVTAAFVFGVASVADQRSTKRVQPRQALSLRIFVDLVRQPMWLASIAGTLGGFALQVLALRYGPLALVEPLLVCGLIFAVLINSYLFRRFDRVLITGVVATAAGIAGFLAISQPTTGQSSIGFAVVLPLGAGLAAAVAGCIVVSRRSNAYGALALALACGICYGVAAFLVKLVVSDVSGGFAGLLADWPIYALAVVGPLGFLLNENAFQHGKLIAPVLAIIIVCDPLISVALAYLWLEEQLNGTPIGIAGEIVSLAVMCTGVVVVAQRAQRINVPAVAQAGPSEGGAERPGAHPAVAVTEDIQRKLR
jgi:drug/metabolite transporter (DMT)-like permease